MLNRISLKFKLVLAFLLVGILPLLISAIMNYWQAFDAINELAIKTARSVAKDKGHAIVSYFEDESLALTDLADNEMTISALEEFSIPFEKDAFESEWLIQNKNILLKYYKEQFGKVYSEQTKKNFNVEKISSQLDGLTVAAQIDFIVNNENPIGKKDLLTSPKRPSPYGNAHARFHPFFHKYIQRHALYDLFIVNPNGRIVYTVFKETDFATSLKTGPWANTGLAKAFEASKKLQQNEVHIEDFSSYTPSYEAPASFAATPIFKNGKYVGSLLIQLPLDKISKIAGNREGLGEKGETLLLGSDLKLRADTFRNKETHTVTASFAEDSKISVESEAVTLAKTGAEGAIKNTSYDGLKTLAYYMPIKIKNLTWFVITELSADETFSVLDSIIKYTVALIIVGFILITLFSSYIGQSLSKSISTIAMQLSSSAEQVAEASKQIAYSSQDLSKSTTEQASSLEETAASLEEITSMISKASDNAEIASQTSSVSHQKAEEGRSAVDQMLVSMDEISQSNDAILNQINESNQHMTEVVKVIQDIGARTKVINEIVFQTKLLSFNASVEAARAGEHGKGFAIVAEEVGNLAQMSGNAAKEITDILEASISKVEGIVQETQQKVEVLIQTGKEKVNTGVSVAQECSNVLNEIVHNVARISNLSQEISLASKEQAQGVAEINKAMSQLDTVTQQNASASEEASKSAIELSSQAQMLKVSVEELLSVVNGSKTGQNEEEVPNINPPLAIKNESKIKILETQLQQSLPQTYSKKAIVNDSMVPDQDDEGFKEV